MIIYFALMFLGILFGIVAPILGIGGGFFFVPTLNILFFLDIHLAISTSMFVIFFTSISGSLRYYKTGRINKETIKIGLILSVTSIFGGIIGSVSKEFLTSEVLKIIFSVILGIIGCYMVFQSIKERNKELNNETITNQEINEIFRKFYIFGTISDNTGKNFNYSFNLLIVLPIAFFSGVLSGLLGIGGGFVNVPTLNILCNLPMHFAVATSTFMIVFAATVNNVTNLIISSIDFLLGIILAAGAIIGAQIGPKIVEKISARNLKIIFGLFTIGFSIYYLIK
ncbi:MAG: sulfite exporter TauE/SafE family protein [Candidatus Helarchaeota archaeon]